MLSSASPATESTDLDTAPGAPNPPALPEPQFSDLIDRWLQEGDRLNEQAAAAQAPAVPASRAERWRQRALELGSTVLERHRLELLVAIGLLPLMLFLITQAGGHHAPAVARRVPTAVPRPPVAPVPWLAAPVPVRPAAAPAAPTLLSEGLLRQCTSGPGPAPVRRAVIHRPKPARRRAALAAAPTKAGASPAKAGASPAKAAASPAKAAASPAKAAASPAKAGPKPQVPPPTRSAPPAPPARSAPPARLARPSPPAPPAPRRR